MFEDLTFMFRAETVCVYICTQVHTLIHKYTHFTVHLLLTLNIPKRNPHSYLGHKFLSLTIGIDPYNVWHFV